MGNKKLLIVIAVLLVVCILCACLGVGGYFLFVQDSEWDPFTGNGTQPAEQAVTPGSEATPETIAPQADTPAVVEQQISVPADQQRWLVMIYQDADDEILERDIHFDANEAEYTGSSDRVTVVSQFDRNAGAYEGDGNWSTARRFVLTANSDLNTLGSAVITDLGEINMGEPQTLIDFATWAIGSYPADRYVLIMSDHGAGWLGGWSDGDNGDDGMSMNEISGALAEILNRTGVPKFDVLAFDACLMSQLEALTMIEPYADYAVASAEVVPAIGFAYNAFISELVNNPAMSPEDFSKWMLAAYIDRDMRITDDLARQEFLSEAFNYTGQATAADLTAEMTLDTTLAVIKLNMLSELNLAFNNFAYEMTFVDQTAVARARSYAQSYYNIFGDSNPPSYIDLGNFVSLVVNETGSTQLSTAANRLFRVMDDAIVAERHSSDLPGATGISIYFPNSYLYTNEIAGYTAYNTQVDQFVQASQWDDFLAFHYTGTPFDLQYSGPVIPAPGTQLQPPGSGNIEMGTLTSSADTISAGQSVHLETQITGDNIGYVYFFAGKFFPENNTYLAVDADFVTAQATQEVNGVTYPDWGSGPIDVSIDWTPTTYFINDGTKNEYAVLYPLEYGATPDQNVYAVDGIFTFGDTGATTYAVMTFRPDGWMLKIMNYAPEGGGGREITPRQGDSFKLLLKAISMDPNDPNKEPEFVEFEGGTLTFGSSNFYWDSAPAEPGSYVVGVGALDLDGNYNLNFVPVTIQ